LHHQGGNTRHQQPNTASCTLGTVCHDDPHDASQRGGSGRTFEGVTAGDSDIQGGFVKPAGESLMTETPLLLTLFQARYQKVRWNDA
jgi:hypothetical protein